MHIEEGVPLASLTTFHIGGRAAFVCHAHSVEDIHEALRFAREKQLPILVLGGGSNVLARDEGFDGVVIKVEIEGVAVEKGESAATVIAGAGEGWDALVARTVAEGLWGLENLSGIPGSVGGAVVQGIGAYGASVGQCLSWVEVLDTELGETRTMNNAECAFDYRDSFFKHDGGRHVVTHVAFALVDNGAPNLSYKDVAQRLGGSAPSLQEVRATILEIRKGKFPDLAVEGTAGSFFKNPILPQTEAEALRERYPEMPLFVLPESQGIKVPLAWLLDNALKIKGERVGGARLFEKQPLVIAAEKNATAHDVRALADIVSSRVAEELKIKIEPEVKIL